MYSRYGKRLLDVALSLCLLVSTLPVWLVTAVILRLRMGAPTFWLQQRPGLGGRPFTVIKFRTMSSRRDADGALLHDAERMTALGAVLRSCSIDELPTLLNVLKGEMSLVGPRPLLPQYLDRYTPEQARRHELRPGITGWAQVNGRNALTWEEKFALDVWYVDHSSFAFDMEILALTVWQVIARRGINQPGHATAEEFMGSGR